MALKTLARSAQFAWSPSSNSNLFIVAGTSAQHFDANFNTTSLLEFAPVTFSTSDQELTVKASVKVKSRFQKLIWVPFGQPDWGTIIGGSDNGLVTIHDAKGTVADGLTSTMAPVAEISKHSGSVKAIDANPFQNKLLASGAGESEIFVWDLNNPTTPMSPGPKTQPFEQVTSLAWNKKVEHILGSSFHGRALIWDLRRNEGPIAKVGDTGQKTSWSSLAWHPEVPTSLCLASEDDHLPVIQLWDLRYAQAPVLQMEGHQRGVMSIGWSNHDPDLLVSCGKDSKIYIWNPNTSEFLAEMPYSSQHWPCEVAWCPKNPNIIGCSALDGQISIYGLNVKGLDHSTPVPSPKLAESFPGMDFNFQPPQSACLKSVAVQNPPVVLPRPPRWMRTPVGARFAFGGKLISFMSPPSNSGSESGQAGLGSLPNSDPPLVAREVTVEQVVTEPELYKSAMAFQDVLRRGALAELCVDRREASADPTERRIWQFISCHFAPENNKHEQLMTALGYDGDDIVGKAVEIGNIDLAIIGLASTDLRSSANDDATPGSPRRSMEPRNTAAVGTVTSNFTNLSVRSSGESSRSVSPLFGLAEALHQPGMVLPNKNDHMDGVLTRTLLSGQHELALELLIQKKEWTNALLLSAVIDSDTLKRTQRRLLQESKDNVTRMICTIMYNRWDVLVSSVVLDNWADTLVGILTHAPMEDIPSIVEALGKRLETEENGRFQNHALICYVCAGMHDAFVAALLSTSQEGIPKLGSKIKNLQDIIEKALILRSAVVFSTDGNERQRAELIGPHLSEQLAKYASVLAEQGCLTMALQYLLTLPDDIDPRLMELRERVYVACGQYAAGVPRPRLPYRAVDVKPEGAAPARHGSVSSYGSSTRTRGPSLSSSYGAGQMLPPPVSYATHQAPAPGVFVPQPTVSYFGTSGATSYPASGYGDSGYQQMGGGFAPPPKPAAAPPLLPPPTSAATGSLSKKAQRSRYPSHSQDSVGRATPPTQYLGAPVAPLPTGQQYGMFTPVPSSVPSGGSMVTPASSMSHQYSSPFPQAQALGSQSHRNPPIAAVAPQPVYDRPKTAWNDPPLAVLTKKKEPSEPSRTNSPAPITCPFLGAENENPFDSTGNPHIPMGGHVPAYVAHNIGHQQHNVLPNKPGAHTEPAALGPIPSEHAVIKKVLDRLIQLSNTSASVTTQMHRKLEEVSKKMESNLYYMLRSNSLSTTSLQNLHQLMGYIQASQLDYALQMHAYMCQGSEFAALSGFMPSLKVLLQTANQLGVQYRS